MLTKQTAARIILKIFFRNKMETNNTQNQSIGHFISLYKKRKNIDTWSDLVLKRINPHSITNLIQH